MDKNILFNQLSDIWLYERKPTLTYNWFNSLKNQIKHSQKYIGNKKVIDIKPFDIDTIIFSLAEYNPNTNKPASKKYLQSLVNTLQRIFDFAIENELIYRNPAKGKKKIIPKNAPQKIVEAITPRQQQLVINVEHRAKTAAIIMMFTGLRTGELLALEWNDIDINQQKLYVHQRAQKIASNKFVVVPKTKNGKNRYIKLPSNIISWLEEKKRNATSYLVCPSLDNKLHSPTQWKKLWQSYQNHINYYCYVENCKKNNKKPNSYYNPHKIPKIEKSFNPHQLRHTYATLLYLSGVDVLTAQYLLGHSDVSTTLKIYTHLDEKYKELKINQFEKYVKLELDFTKI